MSARSYLLNALAQNDVDMNFHKLLNLDTSNLSISGLPPDVAPPIHNFLNSWTRSTQTWGYAQPGFADLSGNLTLSQKLAIDRVGTIIVGTWQANVIGSTYLPTLDAILPPVAAVSMANQRIVNLANPTGSLDAVNLATLTAMVPGLSVKAPCAAATTTDIALVGLNPIDGYTPSSGDRILVKNQTTLRHFQNGVYVAAAGAWARATDFDTSPEFNAAYTLVLNGVTNGNVAFVQITPPPVNIISPDNGTEPVFVVFSHGFSISAGPGLQMSGNVMSAVGTPNRIVVGKSIDIDAAYQGQPSIAILGTITAGTWQGDVLGSAFGGTGISNVGKTITLGASLVIDMTADTPVAAALAFHLASIPTSLNLPPSGTLATLGGNETFTNKHISADQIDSGVMSIARGGTGGSSAPVAISNLLPSQVGQAGKSLKTDGFVVFWG